MKRIWRFTLNKEFTNNKMKLLQFLKHKIHSPKNYPDWQGQVPLCLFGEGLGGEVFRCRIIMKTK